MALKRKGARILSDADPFGKIAQDRVTAHYMNNGAIRNMDEAQALSTFFCPNRVPKGMTNEEVSQCIVAYNLLQWYKIRRLKSGFVSGLLKPDRTENPVPVEFKCKTMTRFRFRKGMARFRAFIAHIIVNDIYLDAINYPMNRPLEVFKGFKPMGGKNFCQPLK